jgi:hypothetical protein
MPSLSTALCIECVSVCACVKVGTSICIFMCAFVCVCVCDMQGRMWNSLHVHASVYYSSGSTC